VSLLSPLRPILRNGNPLLKFLGNAFTGRPPNGQDKWSGAFLADLGWKVGDGEEGSPH